MVKTRTNRRQRLEVKKQMRDEEICPHCNRRCLNLQEHIKREHGFRCDLCSKIFGQRVQWVNHMKDFHQTAEKVAERDSKVSKIDAWLNGQRTKGKVGKSGRAKNRLRASDLAGLASAQGAAAAAVAASAGMEADSDGEAPSALPRCAECGAEGPSEAAALARQGLTFRCDRVGRQCGAAAVARVAAATPAPCLAAGAPPPLQLFGFGAPQLAAAAPTMPMAAPAAFGAPAPLPAASFAATMAAGFNVASSAAQELAAAASVPIDDDDDDL